MTTDNKLCSGCGTGSEYCGFCAVDFSDEKYLAFGEHGEFERAPKTVGQLPRELRGLALYAIQKRLGTDRKIFFGLWLCNSLGLNRGEANSHPLHDLMLTTGDNLPLSLISSDMGGARPKWLDDPTN